MQFTLKQDLLHIQAPFLFIWNGERTRVYNRLLLQCLTSNKPIEVLPSETWSDDSWYIDQENRKFIKMKDTFRFTKEKLLEILSVVI